MWLYFNVAGAGCPIDGIDDWHREHTFRQAVVRPAMHLEHQACEPCR